MTHKANFPYDFRPSEARSYHPWLHALIFGIDASLHFANMVFGASGKGAKGTKKLVYKHISSTYPESMIWMQKRFLEWVISSITIVLEESESFDLSIRLSKGPRKRHHGHCFIKWLMKKNFM